MQVMATDDATDETAITLTSDKYDTDRIYRNELCACKQIRRT